MFRIKRSRRLVFGDSSREFVAENLPAAAQFSLVLNSGPWYRARVIHPTPRADRWDPWIAAALGLIAVGVLTVTLLL